jgi:hypothetical protein
MARANFAWLALTDGDYASAQTERMQRRSSGRKIKAHTLFSGRRFGL